MLLLSSSSGMTGLLLFDILDEALESILLFRIELAYWL